MSLSPARLSALIGAMLLVTACSTAASPAPNTTLSATQPRSEPAGPSVLAPAATSGATPEPTGAATAERSPAPGALPVRGGSLAETWRDGVRIAAGPSGGLYVSVHGEGGSVVALLDSTGRPRAGWPIALDDGFCDLAGQASDGSIRLDCAEFHALTADGLWLAGWPVELPAGNPLVVGDELHAVGYVEDAGQGIVGIRLVTVARDGTIRTGTTIGTPDSIQQDWQPQLGPDGTGYLVAYPSSAASATEITAFDMDGVRDGWPALVDGWPAALAFDRGGRVHVTESQTDGTTSRVLAFGADGGSLGIESAVLPVAATSAYQGAGPFTGAPPPLVSEDGTRFLVSEQGGTTVYAIDPGGRTVTGWPYRDTIGLQWSHIPEGDVGSSSRRSDPVVGPGNVLYLLHPPRTATLGGSIVAIGPDGRVKPGWPVGLTRPGAEFASAVVGPDGTLYALAIEPEGRSAISASVLAIAPDSTVIWTTTVVDP